MGLCWVRAHHSMSSRWAPWRKRPPIRIVHKVLRPEVVVAVETGQGATRGSLKGECATRAPNGIRDETSERLLTAIDESVVVLRKSTVPVALLVEDDGGNALGAPRGVVMECHLTQRPDGGVEEFLGKAVSFVDHKSPKSASTLTWDSLTSCGRLETMIFSAGADVGAAAALGAMTALALALAAGLSPGVPKTWARAFPRFELLRRSFLGREAMILEWSDKDE